MISIIIPVYNGEAFIERCIESLLSSPSPQQTALQVIAVNDGSRDRSSERLHRLAERFPALQVIDKENGGAASARRLGISFATGDYVGFLDADDWADAHYYPALEAKARESGADIVVGNYTEEYPSRSCHVKNRFSEGQVLPLPPKDALSYLHRRLAVFPFPWNKLYRTELLRAIDFPQGNFVGEDYYMQLRLLELANGVDYADVDGYHYVLTENSASRGGYGPATLLAYEHFKEDLEYVRRHYPQQSTEATCYVITEYLACIVAMGRNRVYNKEMIRQIKSFLRKNLWSYVRADYVPAKMKGSALALLISYRLLLGLYRILA